MPRSFWSHSVHFRIFCEYWQLSKRTTFNLPRLNAYSRETFSETSIWHSTGNSSQESQNKKKTSIISKTRDQILKHTNWHLAHLRPGVGNIIHKVYFDPEHVKVTFHSGHFFHNTFSKCYFSHLLLSKCTRYNFEIKNKKERITLCSMEK